jgi:hypothetical protein
MADCRPIVLIAGLFLACPEQKTLPPPQAETQAEPPATIPAMETASSVQSAIELAKPFMDDAPDSHSDGTIYLALWASKRARWEDFRVKKNETTFGRVKKDVDTERGKRMCVNGEIVQIERRRDIGQGFYLETFWGLMMNLDTQNLVSFFAVGSTGDLEQGSPGHLCGIVTGVFEYANSAGGTGHATELVGMFGLKENIAR